MLRLVELRSIWARLEVPKNGVTVVWRRRRQMSTLNSSAIRTSSCRVVDYRLLYRVNNNDNGNNNDNDDVKNYNYDNRCSIIRQQLQQRHHRHHQRRNYKAEEQMESDSNTATNEERESTLNNDESTKLSSSPSPSPSTNTTKKSPTTTSKSSSNALISLLPPSLKPYAHLARIDKPIGTMLLLYPCCWSTAIAAAPTIAPTTTISFATTLGDPSLLLLFTTGSFLMRGAGCTINDLWDAPYDASVSRTRSRPLPNGDLTTYQALGFLTLQTTLGLGVLLSLPHLEYCFWLGAASLPLVVVYPLMKRWMDYPQVVLGLTFNWGAWMGWAATHGSLDSCGGWGVVGPLYAGGVAWTVLYDTLYAHQDKEDDAKLGLKSTALTFGEGGTKPVLGVCAGLAVGSWMLAGWNVGYVGPWYYMGCGLAGVHLGWQVVTADLGDGEGLGRRFRSNGVVGGLMFGSCVAGNLGNIMLVAQ